MHNKTCLIADSWCFLTVVNYIIVSCSEEPMTWRKTKKQKIQLELSIGWHETSNWGHKSLRHPNVFSSSFSNIFCNFWASKIVMCSWLRSWPLGSKILLAKSIPLLLISYVHKLSLTWKYEKAAKLIHWFMSTEMISVLADTEITTQRNTLSPLLRRGLVYHI